jgi:hypothetical protein
MELEPWPSLKDPELIDFMQQYPSRLCKGTHMVLRKFAHGFIACKFSALAYLIIGILWLDRSKTKEEKIAVMTKMDIRRIGAFTNQQLENIFMKNKRVEPSKEIVEFDDITWEDNIALFGIVDSTGNIFHYFLMYKVDDTYSIFSSYGSDSVSIYQYETKVTPIFFVNFVKSLKKENKTTTDKKRIRGFMRAHFLNPVFQLVQRKSDEPRKDLQSMKNTPEDIQDEIERYVKDVSYVIQFQSILPSIQEELSRYESIEADPSEVSITELKDAEAEAEAAEEEERTKEEKGGMRKRMTRKGKRTHYVRSRRMYRRTLHKK